MKIFPSDSEAVSTLRKIETWRDAGHEKKALAKVPGVLFGCFILEDTGIRRV